MRYILMHARLWRDDVTDDTQLWDFSVWHRSLSRASLAEPAHALSRCGAEDSNYDHRSYYICASGSHAPAPLLSPVSIHRPKLKAGGAPATLTNSARSLRHSIPADTRRAPRPTGKRLFSATGRAPPDLTRRFLSRDCSNKQGASAGQGAPPPARDTRKWDRPLPLPPTGRTPRDTSEARRQDGGAPGAALSERLWPPHLSPAPHRRRRRPAAAPPRCATESPAAAQLFGGRAGARCAAPPAALPAPHAGSPAHRWAGLAAP